MIHHDQVGFIPGLQVGFNICKSFSVTHHTNKGKDKNHVLLSIDAGKSIWQNTASFVDKMLNKAGIDGTLLNIIKTIQQRPSANIVIDGETRRAFSLLGSKTRMSSLTIAI